MKNAFFLVLTFASFGLFSQTTSIDEQTQPIVKEGKLLYKSEMASWYGTDLFLENYDDRENIGGYFSYSENDISKCIFFSNSNAPKVIGTITFDDTFSTATAKTDFTQRNFTANESNLYLIRKKALEIINSDKSLFKTYQNTNLNLIPLIKGKERKVYVLTGPQQNGFIIFGNDYLITFSEDNKLLQKKQLHKNILPINYGEQLKKGQVMEGGVHSHLPETGDFITATDICTLMLYSKFAKWKTYNVVSENYMNMWNCETNKLTVITNKALEKINKHQEKKKRKSKKKNKT